MSRHLRYTIDNGLLDHSDYRDWSSGDNSEYYIQRWQHQVLSLPQYRTQSSPIYSRHGAKRSLYHVHMYGKFREQLRLSYAFISFRKSHLQHAYQ